MNRQSSQFRSLYGVRVPAQHFDGIKTIADVLVGQTDHREYLAEGRRRCAQIAYRAWIDAKTPPRNEPTTVRRSRRKAQAAPASVGVVIPFPSQLAQRTECAA